MIEILNSVEDTDAASGDSRDNDVQDFSDLILLEAEDVEEVNLLQIVDTGGEHSGDHQRSKIKDQRSKIYTDTFLVCIVSFCVQTFNPTWVGMPHPTVRVGRGSIRPPPL